MTTVNNNPGTPTEQEQARQQQQQELNELKNSILAQALDQEARARCNNFLNYCYGDL